MGSAAWWRMTRPTRLGSPRWGAASRGEATAPLPTETASRATIVRRTRERSLNARRHRTYPCRDSSRVTRSTSTESCFGAEKGSDRNTRPWLLYSITRDPANWNPGILSRTFLPDPPWLRSLLRPLFPIWVIYIYIFLSYRETVHRWLESTYTCRNILLSQAWLWALQVRLTWAHPHATYDENFDGIKSFGHET